MRTPALLLCLCWIAAQASRACSDDLRFIALTLDGRRAESDTLESWPLGLSKATFAGRSIYEGSDALRWIGDQGLVRHEMGPRLLLDNGDVLCGEIMEVAAEDNLTAWTSLARVSPAGSLRSYDGEAVHVRFDRVLRILGQPPCLAAKVGELILRDGRRLEPRSFRATKYGVSLLTATGTANVPWTDIADWWIREGGRTQAVAADAITVDRETNRIARVTTRDGAVITSGLIFQETERDRKRRRAQRIFYYIQPAWSLSPIGVAGDEIVGCSLREPQELPLSLLDATTIRAEALTSTPRPWQRNANTSGDSVIVGRLMSDLAVGMHSRTEIAFQLPPGAGSFTTYVGMDRTAGEGGCATCAIRSPVAAEALWMAQHITAASDALEVKSIPISDLQQLRLEVDYAHEDRPWGADPLDIRDEVAWLMPLVSVGLESRTSPVISTYWLAGLEGWEVRLALEIVPRWNIRADRWEATMEPEQEAFRLQRSLTVSDDNCIVELRTGCLDDPRKYAVLLLVNDKEVPATTDLSLDRLAKIAAARKPSKRDADGPLDSLTYTWDLSSYRGKRVNVSLKVGGPSHQGHIAWRGLWLRGKER